MNVILFHRKNCPTCHVRTECTLWGRAMWFCEDCETFFKRRYGDKQVVDVGYDKDLQQV